MNPFNRVKIQETSQIIYATIFRKFASYIIDTIVTNVIVLILIYIVDIVFRSSKTVQSIYSQLSASTTTTAKMSISPIILEFIAVYILFFAFYNFFMLLFFSKTIGMFAMNVGYVTPDAQGNPNGLTVPRKFLRGFMGAILGYVLFFIPSIAWATDPYVRSINDRIAGVFTVQSEKGKVRDYIAYIIIGIFLLLVISFNYTAGK